MDYGVYITCCNQVINIQWAKQSLQGKIILALVATIILTSGGIQPASAVTIFLIDSYTAPMSDNCNLTDPTNGGKTGKATPP